MLERKRPLPSKGTDLAANSPPVLEVTVSAVVGNVARLVGGNSGFSALAFGYWVMVVEFSLINAAPAEMAGHSLLSALLL